MRESYVFESLELVHLMERYDTVHYSQSYLFRIAPMSNPHTPPLCWHKKGGNNRNVKCPTIPRTAEEYRELLSAASSHRRGRWPFNDGQLKIRDNWRLHQVVFNCRLHRQLEVVQGTRCPTLSVCLQLRGCSYPERMSLRVSRSCFS